MFWKKSHIERIQVEDALKHIYNCEYQEITATIFSLAGALELKQKKVLSLVSRMEKEGLLKVSKDGLQLRPYGRARGLQVIRAHRLWESYLTDYTSVPLEEIHERADKEEHNITPVQIEKLEAQLGYPTRDPHGDAIPSANYKMAQSNAKSLVDWPIGLFARIVHIEDEPQSIYTQILAEGLILDSYLKILESTKEGIHLWTYVSECWLAPIVAANIYVEEAPLWMEGVEVELCSTLQPGERGRILFLKEQGAARRRLLDLGVVTGTIIQAVMTSALKEPKAYLVKDTMIALRKEQAERIFIQRIKNNNDQASVPMK